MHKEYWLKICKEKPEIFVNAPRDTDVGLPEEILSTQAKEIIKKIVATGQEKFNVVISRGEVFLQFYREGTKIPIYNRDSVQDDLNKLVKLGLLIYVRQNRDGHDIYKRGEKAINYVKRLRENEEAVGESMDSTIEGA